MSKIEIKSSNINIDLILKIIISIVDFKFFLNLHVLFFRLPACKSRVTLQQESWLYLAII